MTYIIWVNGEEQKEIGANGGEVIYEPIGEIVIFHIMADTKKDALLKLKERVDFALFVMEAEKYD